MSSHTSSSYLLNDSVGGTLGIVKERLDLGLGVVRGRMSVVTKLLGSRLLGILAKVVSECGWEDIERHALSAEEIPG